ncbi:hypothetical protein FRC08_007165 [Ceratobasidium sp. 394]|nr:hypothetical protein FRC08_007165 [Ceratobasidium sp. 394]
MESPSHHRDHSSFYRTFQVPELCRAICNVLDKKYYANLLYLSRLTYDCTLPIVWEDTDFRALLLLIPEVTETREDQSPTPYGGELDHVFNLPSVPDLSRFNIHSPFVRKLRTTGSYIIHFPKKWSNLGARTESELLPPNLKYLATNTFSLAKPEHVSWIPRLLHPDLLGFEMYSLSAENRGWRVEEVHSWLDQGTCIDLIDRLSRTCPRLNTLRVYPAEQQDLPSDQCLAMYSKIAGLKHLRSLTFGVAVLHQELLQALGQLPHLEMLSLRADESQCQGDNGDPIRVPDDSFPSLRHLDLHFLNEPAMFRICHLPQLFCGMVSAAIIFEGKPHWGGVMIGGRLNRSELAFACLGANSPRLERLTVLTEGDIESPLEISWPIIIALKLMALRYLRVGTINFGDRFSFATLQNPRSEITWERLLAAVPHLEELDMVTQKLELEELQLIGRSLPKLRLLVFSEIDLCNAGQPIDVVNANQAITIRCWSYFGSKLRRFGAGRGVWISHIPDEPSVLNAARCLYGMWPNRYEPNQQAGQRLNEAIAQLKHGAERE